MKKILTYLAAPYMLETIFWLAALVAPIFINPAEPHVSFCLFKQIGIDFCPGCGLGRSLALLYRGDMVGSFLCHPLGIPAAVIIGGRIISLLRKLHKSIDLKIGVTHG